jgi:hypothetical protein
MFGGCEPPRSSGGKACSMPATDAWLSPAEVAARLGISLAAGYAPARDAYALLGLLVLAIGKHFLVPILQAFGESIAARIRTRLTPTKAQRDRQAGKRKRG